MVQVARNRGIFGLKLPEPLLHPMIGSRLPYKLDLIRIIRLRRRRTRKQFQTDLLITRNLNNNSLRSPLILIRNLQLIARKQTSIIVLSTAEHEVSIAFLAFGADIEGYLHVVLGLALLYFPVCLCLLGDQGFED